MNTISRNLAIAAAGALGIGLWWANQHYIVNPAVDRANAAWQQRS